MITEENKELILINRYIQAEIMDKMCKTSDSKEIYILANFLHKIEIYE